MIDHIKYTNLIAYLRGLGNIAVAFSGGVDSTFLLVAAKEAVKENLVAFTVRAPYIANWEIEESIELCNSLGIHHKIIDAPIPEEIRNNPVDRCYLCKRKIFSTLIEAAGNEGIKYVLDGTNHDDPSDHRPGLKALRELGVISPLLEMKISKAEIREFSKKMGLPTWDKPPYACLLTRLPHGTEIKPDELMRIERGEKYLMDLGYRAVRVRSHGDLARIETDQEIIPDITSRRISQQITAKFREIGFTYVTIDLEGYRTGSFNPGNE
jgi:uncharacterized protein